MSNKLKGVWVEGFLWESKDFKVIEKHLLQKLKDLDNDKGCTAMNAWLAEFLGISKSRVSQLISKFNKQKLISVKLKFKGKEVIGRVIRILKGGMLYFKEGMLNIKHPISFLAIPPVLSSEVSNTVLSNRVKEYKEKEKKYKKDISILQKRIKELESETDKEETKDESKFPFLGEVREILLFFISETGKQLIFKKLETSDKYKKIMPRLKEGATVDECKAVIVLKSKQWKNDKRMSQHLCIPTLFGLKNFEKYLDEIGNSKTGVKKFTYPLPPFLDSEDRQSYFYLRYDSYKPYLDIQKVNTVYKKRALYEKDAEGLCFELELQIPKLAEIQVNYNRL